MNLHAAASTDELFDSLRSVTLPLRDALAPDGEPFALGMYFPAPLAFQLLQDLRARERLIAFLQSERLDPFSFNAFPYDNFQQDALKERVYAPDWSTSERLSYTLAVAQLALAFREASAGSHISISTHAGGWGADLQHQPRADAAREGLLAAAIAIDELAREHERSIVLAVEAEPRSNANDTREAAAIVRELSAGLSSLGLCLDACHSAVEFEDPAAAARLALSTGNFGKLQYTSALSCPGPETDGEAYAELLAMHEARFLHQVSARAGERRLAWSDLDELARTGPRGAEELRCHFHVPVDAERIGRLCTTRAHARAILTQLVQNPAAWPGAELHVEIETYTWSVLPGKARPAGSLPSALAREYRAVLDVLAPLGWHRA